MNSGTEFKMKQCHCYYLLLFVMLIHVFLTRLKNLLLEVRVGNN